MHTRIWQWLAAVVVAAGLAFGQEQVPTPADEGASLVEPPPASPAPSDEPTVASIDARISSIEAGEGLDAAAAERALALLREARADLERAAASEAARAGFQKESDEAPALEQTIREEMAQAAPEPTVSPAADATVAQLEQQLDEAKAQLQIATNRQSEIQNERTRRSERRSAIPARTAQVREDLEEARSSISSIARTDGEAEAVFEARRWLLMARERALSGELSALEAELASYDARQRLLPLRLDRAERRVTTGEKLVSAWQKELSDARQREAQRAAAEAERAATGAARRHPVLEAYAGATAELAEVRVGDDGLIEEVDATNRRISEIRTQLRRLRDGFQSLSRRLEVSGLSRATGLMLRREFEALPKTSELRGQLRKLGDRLDEVEYDLLEYQDQRRDQGAVDRALAELMGEVEAGGGFEDRERLEAAARDLVVARRDLLDELVSDSTHLLERLVEREEALRTLLRATEAYEAFVEERILWVRSIPSDYVGGADEFVEAYGWMTDGAAWSRSIDGMRRYVGDRWPRVTLVVALVVLAFALGPWARRRLRELSARVGSYRTDRFWYSVEALLLTLGLSLRLPLLMWMVGWLMSARSYEADAAGALAHALWIVAPIFAPLEFLRVATRPGGLAESHLRWPRSATRGLHRHLLWFVPAAISLGVLMRTTTYAPSEPVQATLGRVLFTALGIVASVWVFAVFRPGGRVLRDWMRAHEASWINRLRMAWWPAMFLAPMVLVVAAWMGFFYTAVRLGRQYGLTLVMAMSLVVAQGLMLRWLFIQRRRVAIEQARRRREEAAGSEGSGEAAHETPLEDRTLDLPAISAQTRQLFTTGVWVTALIGLFAVWADALPALRMFDRMQVWPRMMMVESLELERPDILSPGARLAGEPAAGGPESADEAAASANGAAPEATGAAGVPGGVPLTPLLPGSAPEGDGAGAPGPRLSITLADIGVFLLTLVGTVVVFRNLPGVIEILVLPRLPLDAGARYALTTVIRYLITIVGVTIAFAALGVTWTSLQWLAAALTFGLAFGLQEIFANFMSAADHPRGAPVSASATP
jgi:potassium efflux system protein